jgi:hypothetical protein
VETDGEGDAPGLGYVPAVQKENVTSGLIPLAPYKTIGWAFPELLDEKELHLIVERSQPLVFNGPASPDIPQCKFLQEHLPYLCL